MCTHRSRCFAYSWRFAYSWEQVLCLQQALCLQLDDKTGGNDKVAML